MGRTPRKGRNRNVDTGRYDSPSAHAGGSSSGASANAPATSEPIYAQVAISALLGLLSRDDGWLRVVPHEHGATTYYKWKFSRGKWRGYYSMFRDDRMDPSDALNGLLSKLERIDNGEARPTKDTAYDG